MARNDLAQARASQKSPFSGLNNTTTRPQTYSKFSLPQNIVDTKSAVNSGAFFSNDITKATLPKGKLTFKDNLFGTSTPSPLRGGQPTFQPLMAGTQIPGPTFSSETSKGGGQTFDNDAALADLQRQATEQSSQQIMGEGEQVAAGGSESGGTGTNGAGAGGYTPPGFSPIEEGAGAQEGVDTGQPSPGGVQAQPFTQGGGALTAGGEGTQSKFQKGFNQALASMGDTGIVSGGVGGAGGGVSGAQGASLVQQYSPTKSNTLASMFVQTDPVLTSLVSSLQQYMDTVSQRASLTETYNQLIKNSGVEALDMELLDIKNVIDGNEEMLRDEITKAGGTANEGQIQALKISRNKQLIKNFNKLLNLRNSKEKYLSLAISLEAQDRQSADTRFNNVFNMGMQIADYQQKMQTNAINQMKWNVDKMGFDGLYNSTGGDPYTIDLVEQTLGLPRGGLVSSANQAMQARAQAKQEKELDVKYKQAQISNIYSEIAQRNADNTMVFDPMGKLMVKPKEAMKINKELVNSYAYKALTKAKDSLQYLKQFESTFNKTGATSAVFSPRQNAKLKAEYNTAILNLKEFFNLGVLNGPDEAILRSVLPDPTNRSAALSVLSLGIYKPSAATKAGIDNMNKMIEASLDDRFKSLSSQYGDYSPYSVNGLRDLNRVYVEQKAKLDPNIQQLISENPDLTADDILMIISQ